MSSTNPVINPRDFGAAGDGLSDDTRHLQAAINSCDATGGTVWVPPGMYVTGSLFLHSNLNLILDAGAVLLGSEDPQLYPIIESRWEGAHQLTHAPLIAGQNLENITISGRGKIDGRGNRWWQALRAGTLEYPRPRLISLADCKNVLIESITAVNSPAWTVNPVRCENVTIRGLTITNPPDSPNTDGINPDSCRQVRISDCHISAGDDCITIKAGTQFEHPHLRAACRDITITNCTMERGHGGVVIGSEMSGDVQNVVISNCVMVGTDRGIRLKSRRGRGGRVENIIVSNLIMDEVLCPFTMNMYYHCNGAQGNKIISDKKARPVDETTPSFRHIHISHVSAVGVKTAAGYLYGLAEMPLEDISFNNIYISMSDSAEPGFPEMADDMPRMCKAGFYIRNARQLVMERVQVRGQIGEAFDMDDSVEVVMRS